MGLHRWKDVEQCRVLATDGLLGRVDDAMVDTDEWRARYLVVDTHPWWPGGKTLVSVEALQGPDWSNGQIPVDLEKKQVRESPPVDLDGPITRVVEHRLHLHYSWPPYWGAPGASLGGTPVMAVTPVEPEDAAVMQEGAASEREGRSQVYRFSRMQGFEVCAGGETLGYIDEALLDDSDWSFPYLVAESHKWLPGRKWLLMPAWIQRLERSSRRIVLSVDKDLIENSPPYDPDKTMDREYEQTLARYYRTHA